MINQKSSGIRPFFITTKTFSFYEEPKFQIKEVNNQLHRILILTKNKTFPLDTVFRQLLMIGFEYSPIKMVKLPRYKDCH